MRFATLHKRATRVALIGLAFGLLSRAHAAGDTDFFELSLQELLQVEVTSVSKKAQPLNETPAAVFVITAEDLRRSGVTTIADALRMVPGVQVAQVDGNNWAISARGHNGRFANKLLVLMDGRSLYSPLYSTVFWDSVDTVFEDIERIEVIRGPGATLWGANAVNGVINIITRSAADSTGTLVSALAGNEESGTVGLRHGAALGDHGHYRIWGKFSRRDGLVTETQGTDTNDESAYERIGVRGDWSWSGNRELSIQAEAYDGHSNETSQELSLAPPFVSFVDRQQDRRGSFFNLHWKSPLGEHSEYSVSAYADQQDREWSVIDENRVTANIDVQYRTRRFEDHDLIFGASYRQSHGEASLSVRATPARLERTDNWSSLFVQDDITLAPERWVLTLGTKLEENDYTGTEHQPNVRLRWTPNQRQTLWGAVARAVRTPGRANSEFSVIRSLLAPGEGLNQTPVPLVIEINGTENSESEVLLAYEMGYRQQVSDTASFDLALFYNDYDNLRTLTPAGTTCVPNGGTPPACLFGGATSLTQTFVLSNEARGVTTGLEASLELHASSRWRLQASYGYLDFDVEVTDGSLMEDIGAINPRHQLSVRSRYDFDHGQQLDLWLRYVDELRIDRDTSPVAQRIPAYTELDLRYAWQIRPDLELSLVGRNLLADSHVEFLSELEDIQLTAVERSYYGQLRWQF